MEINGNLDVREIAPRVIDGWSDVRFSDEETTSADFFEAVRQAILERANAVSTSISSGKYPVNTPTFSWGKDGYIQTLARYPITQNTLSYEIFDIIENAIYEISSYFLCGIGDSSAEIIGYRYRENLDDFPFVMERNSFGINDDIAFFKRPNTMPTWNEMKSSGYAHRLMNAINAMTSMKIGYVYKQRNLDWGFSFDAPWEGWDNFITLINAESHAKLRDKYENSIVESNFPYSQYDVNGFFGYRLITNYGTMSAYSKIYYSKGLYELVSAIHPGMGIGADCLLRNVFVSFDTYSDFGNNTGVNDSYVENIEFLSLRSGDPLFCPHDRMIYAPDHAIYIIPSFSPSVLPPDPDTYKGTVCYQYGQRYRFRQYYDFGIPGGFRFRKDT